MLPDEDCLYPPGIRGCHTGHHALDAFSNDHYYPVYLPWSYLLRQKPDTKPRLPVYYTAKWCRHCGHEERTYHNWPDDLPRPPDSASAANI